MDNKLILLIILLVILLAIFFFWFFWNQPIKKLGKVCIKNICYEVELAETTIEKTKGLMYRKMMDEDRGMLFLYDKEGIRSFWMKNTFIPLDILWISKDNKVVFISENTQPCKQMVCPSIDPGVKALYVLEINGGLCLKNNIKVGDEVKVIK